MKIVALTMLLSSAVALADDAPEYSVESGEITYHLVHKLHRVDGRSRTVHGRGRFLGDGSLQVVVEVPAESFDSGNSNRDEHMKEAVEAGRFPSMRVKALCKSAQPESPSQKLGCKAQIDLHGNKQIIDVQVELSQLADGRRRATTHFTISLDAFKVERPSLMFVKVDDELGIDANLIFRH